MKAPSPPFMIRDPGSVKFAGALASGFAFPSALARSLSSLIGRRIAARRRPQVLRQLVPVVVGPVLRVLLGVGAVAVLEPLLPLGRDPVHLHLHPVVAHRSEE